MQSGITDRPERRHGHAADFLLLLFNASNQVLLRHSGAAESAAWTVSADGALGADGKVPEAASGAVGALDEPVRLLEIETAGGGKTAVFASLIGEEEFADAAGDRAFFSLEEIRQGLRSARQNFSPELAAILEKIGPHLIRVPYLQKGEHDFIYRFRPERERNRSVYNIDRESEALYQSDLCRAIKEVKRINERSATSPATLDFGAVSYVLPSHFGFCLGVQNAIERAYESLAENPGKQVYMLSELIHNPFVNDDLRARGLRYLQSDKGVPLKDERTGELLWDRLGKDDVVVIPAFGATDADKTRLIEKGISINRYDATCMLVEKVWKAARRFGRDGYTVIIHGKAEHEETKATFSNAAKTGPALIVRNQEEAERLGAVIQAESLEEKRELFAFFAGKHTDGFDPARDLERIAVVNQTTLLRNATLGIIDYLGGILERKYGSENLGHHLNSNSKGDTLCYATQVNQDALQRALAMDLDFAIVAGGKNSSNTYQLFRLCKERLGKRAFYIQSERSIRDRETILHCDFDPGAGPSEGTLAELPFLSDTDRPVRVLLTGGASCPDGILQQIIVRINGFFPQDRIRPVADVLGDLE